MLLQDFHRFVMRFWQVADDGSQLRNLSDRIIRPICFKKGHIIRNCYDRLRHFLEESHKNLSHCFDIVGESGLITGVEFIYSWHVCNYLAPL